MKNLIFVAKSTGLECLKFHLENFKNDNNIIVACDPDKQMILSYLLSKNIPCIDIDSFCSNDLKEKRFDWLLNLWGGCIFKKDLLSLVRNSLNIHPSYLPYGRGRDPVVWAIRDRSPAGVTLHEINEQVDGGSIWYQEEVPYILPISGDTLYRDVVLACIRIFKENWANIRNLTYKKFPQSDLNIKTKKRKDLFEDQLIDYDLLSSDQKELFLKVLAHDFGDNYCSIIKINNEKLKLRLKLEKIEEN